MTAVLRPMQKDLAAFVLMLKRGGVLFEILQWNDKPPVCLDRSIVIGHDLNVVFDFDKEGVFQGVREAEAEIRKVSVCRACKAPEGHEWWCPTTDSNLATA